MSMGKCTKLAPWFCRPFIVLKRIGSSAYRLAFPDGVVSHLKELLSSGGNTITTETMVTKFEKLFSKQHVPERILNVKTNNLRI